MPIYRFAAYSSNAFYLIWKIEENSATLHSQLPLQFLADFHSARLSSKDRIQQSLAVRIALCYLLKALNLPILPLSKDAQGKPVLAGSGLCVSFTHTRYLAAVALSTSSPIGIDIERVQPTLHRVQKKFLTEAEAQSANNCLEKLAIYWSAKEALYKRLDKQEMPSMQYGFIEPFPLQTEGRVVARLYQKRYTMGYWCISDGLAEPHVLVCCEG